MNDPLRTIHEGVDKMLTWGGRPIWKNPVDLVVYQEIAQLVRPTLVIETGTHLGGSAEFWRSITGAQVITVDVDQQCDWADHEGILALEGSSTAPQIVEEVGRYVKDSDQVLVNLDSDHGYKHVLAELNAYAGFVTLGSYMIVEDGIDDRCGGAVGSWQACNRWLPSHPEFIADAYPERTGVSNNPLGFLRRIA